MQIRGGKQQILREAPHAAKKCLHFSICACHLCAGAMLIFAVSFQARMLLHKINEKIIEIIWFRYGFHLGV